MYDRRRIREKKLISVHDRYKLQLEARSIVSVTSIPDTTKVDNLKAFSCSVTYLIMHTTSYIILLQMKGSLQC